jgi:hypothetical protein
MTPDEAVKFWLEESKLMWSRVQTVSALEAATVGGWYATKSDPNLGLAIMGVGTFLMLLICLLMKRDAQFMHACQAIAGDKMPPVAKPLFGLRGRHIAVIIPIVLVLANAFAIYKGA